MGLDDLACQGEAQPQPLLFLPVLRRYEIGLKELGLALLRDRLSVVADADGDKGVVPEGLDGYVLAWGGSP